MKILEKSVAVILLGFALISCNGSTPQQGKQKKELPTYRIGYMICNSEKDTLDRFIPFTAYLSKKLGVNFEPVAIDTINFTKEMDSLDFTHTNSLLYIILNRFHGVDILAAEKKGSLGEKSQGIIIARRDSDTARAVSRSTHIFRPIMSALY